ncbi:PhzF family phenazine biosynthesis protein [Candidatus Protochlamydia phocaeensis]|uniref:PhzF family phenazine biosynthesis protein n=1 Tax=Candidatus Protochlamydia phocaeensis TaxID=1414722 RepID=UPI00083821C7|nr:PhzF family phenazine biosynthesis protein [Candidatus Protochlamydia phocaeensis]
MREFSLHHIDSFTAELFGGNPTATVLNAERLSDEEMKKIAKEMNLSETGFVLPSRQADFKLRFFTPPGNEIKFCGHATIGALCALAKEKRLGMTEKKRYAFRVETNAGLLPMEVDLSDLEQPVYTFNAPKIDLVPAPYSLEEVVKALDIPGECVDWTKPLMLERTNQYLYFSAVSLETLGQMTIHVPKAIEFAKRDGIVVFCALTPHAFDSRHHVHARGFAPLVGVPEDPFTGSMQGGLAAYLLANQMIAPDAVRLVSEQGHFMNRPGFVDMEIQRQPVLNVRLHARAKHVFATKLILE